MNITIENKKQKAIELMQKLDIYKPYIKGFKDKTDVCFFECFGGYWAYQEPELICVNRWGLWKAVTQEKRLNLPSLFPFALRNQEKKPLLKFNLERYRSDSTKAPTRSS